MSAGLLYMKRAASPRSKTGTTSRTSPRDSIVGDLGDSFVCKACRSGAGPDLHAAREVLNSPGRDLDASTRSLMETRFAHNFGRVRVHTDADATASARALGAAAYTVGRHIVFGHGNYQPGNQRGRALLGHELTHTIQQEESTQGSGPLTLGAASDAAEHEAGRAATALAGHGPIAVKSRRSLAVQRQPVPGAPPHFDLAESASPMMARAIGSVTIDGFETGKDIISKVNQTRLAKTASTIQTLLNKYPGSTIRVIGHTDAAGKEMDNQSLGQARADAVRAALVRLGIPAEAIQAESKGKTQLLVQTQKAESRNRRADVKFEPEANQFPSFLPDTSLSPPPPAAPVGGFGFKPDTDLSKIVTPGPPYVTKDPPGSVPSSVFKPIPPLKPGKNDPFTNPIDSFADSITSSVPKSIRGVAKDLVIGAISKGLTSGLDAGLDKAGVSSYDRQAIEKAVEAAIKQPSEAKK